MPLPSRPEDELLEQWSFLDSMVERQASSLRAGAQDTEEPEPTPASTAADERQELRDRVALLERERGALRAQLEGRDRELRRAEQHSADLMRSLRDAHATLEEARQVAAAAERRAAAAEEATRRITAQAEHPAAPADVSARSAMAPGDLAVQQPAAPRTHPERPQRSAILANPDPPQPAPKPSWIDRLLGRS